METELLRTYKFYTKKGQRLAVFGQVTPEGYIKIFILTCSKDDQFSKKFALECYNNFIKDGKTIYVDKEGNPQEFHPYQETIKVIDEKPKFTFIKYCKLNLYRKGLDTTTIYYDVFIKQNVFKLPVADGESI